jgi:hypothetical protein
MSEGIVFELSCSMFTSYDNGFVTAQPDAEGDGATVPAFEVRHSYGTISRPRDPDVDATGANPLGCTIMYGWEGDRGHAWFLDDPRVAALLPLKVEPGGYMNYSHRDDGQLSILRLRGTDGTFVVYAPGKDGKTQGSYIMLDPVNGLDISTPWGRFMMGPSGVVLRDISGARLELGTIGGLPPPLDALASRAKLSAATVAVNGSAVSLGTDGGATSQLAIEALITCIRAFAAQVATITTATPGATAMAEPAFVTLLAALDVALAPIGKVA